MRTWIVVLVVAVLLTIAWMVVSASNGGMPVETAVVGRGPISEYVDERGKTRLPTTHLITMPFGGRVVDLARLESEQNKKLDEGAAVARGEVVAKLVQKDLELELETAQAAVQRLDAAIAESRHMKVEETALLQAGEYVASMADAVTAANQRIRAGKAKYEFAQDHLRRIQKLFAGGQTTQEELDEAMLQATQGDVDYNQDVLVHSSLKAMQAATNLLPRLVTEYIERKGLGTTVRQEEKDEAMVRLQQAQQNYDRGVMRSPVDGVILERPIRNQRYVEAGTVLAEIGRLSKLEVEADVLSQDVVRVELGDGVDIYGPAIGPEPVRGAVSNIYKAGFTKVSSLGVEEQRVKIIIRFAPQVLPELIAQRGLGVGYRVRVRIFTDQRDQTLIVPRSALFRGAVGGWEVFTVSAGSARLRNVEVGLMNDERVEILSGLEEGEQVILAPETSLADGVKVAPVETQMPASGD